MSPGSVPAMPTATCRPMKSEQRAHDREVGGDACPRCRGAGPSPPPARPSGSVGPVHDGERSGGDRVARRTWRTARPAAAPSSASTTCAHLGNGTGGPWSRQPRNSAATSSPKRLGRGADELAELGERAAQRRRTTMRTARAHVDPRVRARGPSPARPGRGPTAPTPSRRRTRPRRRRRRAASTGSMTSGRVFTGEPRGRGPCDVAVDRERPRCAAAGRRDPAGDDVGPRRRRPCARSRRGGARARRPRRELAAARCDSTQSPSSTPVTSRRMRASACASPRPCCVGHRRPAPSAPARARSARRRPATPAAR